MSFQNFGRGSRDGREAPRPFAVRRVEEPVYEEAYDADYYQELPAEMAPSTPLGSGNIEDDLRHLLDLVNNAKRAPLSSSVLVPQDEVLDLLEQALANVPEEIRDARWALRDREAMMAAERQKANQLMDQVRAEAARMVDKSELVRQSRLRAEEILDDAQAKARTLLNETQDFIDSKLAGFEIVLERLLKTTRSGRERMDAQGIAAPLINDAPPVERILPAAPPPAPHYDEVPGFDQPTDFFDQDAL